MSESKPSAGPSLSPIEQAAVRRLIARLDPKELSEDESMVDRANRAGERWDRMQEQISTLSNELIELTEQLEELSAAIQNDDYENMTREQKRLRVKRLVQNEAKNNGGKGAVDYNSVRAAFKNKISKGTAPYLMREVAEDPGYQYDERDGANNVLKVDLSETEERLFSSKQ